MHVFKQFKCKGVNSMMITAWWWQTDNDRLMDGQHATSLKILKIRFLYLWRPSKQFQQYFSYITAASLPNRVSEWQNHYWSALLQVTGHLLLLDGYSRYLLAQRTWPVKGLDQQPSALEVKMLHALSHAANPFEFRWARSKQSC